MVKDVTQESVDEMATHKASVEKGLASQTRRLPDREFEQMELQRFEEW